MPYVDLGVDKDLGDNQVIEIDDDDVDRYTCDWRRIILAPADEDFQSPR